MFFEKELEKFIEKPKSKKAKKAFSAEFGKPENNWEQLKNRPNNLELNVELSQDALNDFVWELQKMNKDFSPNQRSFISNLQVTLIEAFLDKCKGKDMNEQVAVKCNMSF